MDRNTAKKLDTELKALLTKFAEDHGLVLTTSGGSYTDTSFSPKITFNEQAADGTAKLSNYLTSKINWELLVSGLPEMKAEDVMGKKFLLLGGAKATVVDFQARGKYHWIVRKEDGTTVRCTIDHLLKFAHPVVA